MNVFGKGRNRKDFEMSISEQVKELRKYAGFFKNDRIDGNLSPIFRNAADTIESLSAKLEAANMEKSDRYYGGGWILSKDRLPTKEECGNYRGHFLVTVYASELKTLCMEYEYTTIRGKGVGKWTWCDRANIPWEVIAWKKFPEPYRP